MTGNLTINKQQGQKITCFCRDCHRETKHEIIAEATLSGSDESGGYSTGWAIEHQIIRCLGCETFSFRKIAGTEHDYVQIDENEWEYQASIDIYPNPRQGRQPLADAGLLPDKIQRIYEESLQALNDIQPVLCGIGTRAIIETVCKDKNATGGDLYNKINSLVGLGVLTRDGADILHKLRTLGNDAAHEVKPHSLQELGLAFDVVDHLLLGVYILPDHAKKTFK
ncbi:hypothetical protein F506_07220 [Herbaspirillum hiltneri N3]|uniref:DUF4145 domain-containing protein n=1 Tax=Herbaspirillum hiltneri N3 TaxID=1262470 RepID=A0ABN4HV49_9BURK|nr:DUF4145 domain-containing protein [Herbaspirillum hiltneri]AKZ62494.1 hypothetical protein F506_07220 [Herbaspirillum hiltneri N3]